MPFRIARNLLVDDGIERRTLGRVNPLRDIIAIRVGGLLSLHARRLSEPVVYRPVSTWIRKANGHREADPSATTLAAIWVRASQAALEEIGEKLSPSNSRYLNAWLLDALGCLAAQWRALEADGKRLPRRLWVGAGSNPWVRLLCEAVRRHGGEVTGHDHATGYGHIDSEVKTLVDLWACDTFVTFNHEARAALSETARPDLLLGRTLPRIVGLPERQANTLKVAYLATEEFGPVRRVVYLSPIYGGDRMIYQPTPPDLLLFDWQARLLSKLRSWGYDVTLKVHPESRIEIPAALCALPGIHVERRPFESITRDGDLFLFDLPVSTTFGHALSLPRPVVLIDFSFVRFTPRGRALLARRCAFVSGRIDADNRAQVEWDDLAVAIRKSRCLADPSFVETYLKRA
jgi:hypothetical protein